MTHDPSKTVWSLMKMSLRSRIQEDPYYRFKSAFDIAVAADLGVHINVNQASVDDWLRLPGISIHQARQLVELTRAGVHFYSISDLAAALNVPMSKLQWLAPVLSFQYYDRTLDLPSVRVNAATIDELTQIPQISPELATAIITTRDRDGAFANLLDFKQRLDLSGELVGELMHYLQF